MPYRFGPLTPSELAQLAREQLERERLEQLLLDSMYQRPAGSPTPLLRTGPVPISSSWDEGPVLQPLPYRPLPGPSIDPKYFMKPMPARPLPPGSSIDPKDLMKPVPARPIPPGVSIDPTDAIQLMGLFDRQSFEPAHAHDSLKAFGPAGLGSNSANRDNGFPFRKDNRKTDGTWDGPDATDDNIKGTSVDPYDPVWPRWKQRPPPHGEGDFVSDEPFFDIDEITQKAEFYPPGRPLMDKNVEGNPASRQRVGKMPGGNLWRRRLLVDGGDFAGAAPASQPTPPTQRAGSPQGQGGGAPVAAGDLTDFQVVSRNRAGGASNSQAYAHWLGGSGRPLDIDFSDANVDSSLTKIIGESAAGMTGPKSFQTAINQSLANNGAPAFVDTTAEVDTGGAVIGRVNTDLQGWVTTNGGKWQFEGYVTARPEQFDFNPDPDRGPFKNEVAKAVGAVGHALGAADYRATYTGSVVIRASGNIRR